MLKFLQTVILIMIFWFLKINDYSEQEDSQAAFPDFFFFYDPRHTTSVGEDQGSLPVSLNSLRQSLHEFINATHRSQLKLYGEWQEALLFVSLIYMIFLLHQEHDLGQHAIRKKKPFHIAVFEMSIEHPKEDQFSRARVLISLF